MSGEGRTRRLGAAPLWTPRGTVPFARPRPIGAHTLRATYTFTLPRLKTLKSIFGKFSINIYIISSPYKTLK